MGLGRGALAPLVFLNFALYVAVVGFASWNLNHYISGQTAFPVSGNGATFYFLVFAILAGVLGVVSKFIGSTHLRAWRGESLAAAASSSFIAWAVTTLAFGLACKEIHIGGYRGWRLRVLEALIIIVGFTQLFYVLLLHSGIYSSRYGPGYRDSGYASGTSPDEPKGTARV